jgi:hypothetical protein
MRQATQGAINMNARDKAILLKLASDQADAFDTYIERSVSKRNCTHPEARNAYSFHFDKIDTVLSIVKALGDKDLAHEIEAQLYRTHDSATRAGILAS